jgi:hypothetical protein
VEAEGAGTRGGSVAGEDGLAEIAPPDADGVLEGGAAVWGKGCEVCCDGCCGGADALFDGAPATLLPMLSIRAPIPWRCERIYGTLIAEAAITKQIIITTINPLRLCSSSGSDCPEIQGEREKSSRVSRGGNKGRGSSARECAAGVCGALGLFSGAWVESLGAFAAETSAGIPRERGIAGGRLSADEASPAETSARLVSAGEAVDSS